MKQQISVLIALMSVLSVGTVKAVQATDAISRSGDIQGSVNVCGLGGKPGIMVSIPGRSFSAYSDAQGRFRLSYVPAGVYQLSFSQFDTPMGNSTTVIVAAKNTANLGAVNVCAQAAVCPSEYAPVCGVDGVTYLNDCEAAHAHAAIASGGECS